MAPRGPRLTLPHPGRADTAPGGLGHPKPGGMGDSLRLDSRLCDPGPPGSGDVGHRKRGGAGGRVWAPAARRADAASPALRLAAPGPAPRRWRDGPFLNGLIYFCQTVKKMFRLGLCDDNEGLAHGKPAAEDVFNIHARS